MDKKLIQLFNEGEFEELEKELKKLEIRKVYKKSFRS